MTQASLTNIGEATFAFEHAMAHRTLLGTIYPLNRFSGIPYFIDPMTPAAPADMWHLDHQRAHDDALTTLPSAYGSTAVGLSIGTNLVDTDLHDAEVRAWWTHQNHIEHMQALATVLPATTPSPPPTGSNFRTWRYPFW